MKIELGHGLSRAPITFKGVLQYGTVTILYVDDKMHSAWRPNGDLVPIGEVETAIDERSKNEQGS